MTTTTQTRKTRFPGPIDAWWNFRRKRFWLITLVLLYTLSGFVLAPWLAERQLRVFVQDSLGLELQLDRMRLNPWVLTAEAQGFSLRDDAGSLISFDRLFVNLQTSSLFRRALTLREITLENPRVNVVVAQDGELNLLALMPPAGEPEPDEEADDPTPLRWLIHDLNILGGSANLRDETPETPFEMEIGPIDIALNTLSTLPEFGGNQQITIVAENEATLSLQGAIDLQPVTLTGQLVANGDFLAFAHRYFQDRLNFDLQESRIELSLDYAFSLDGGLEASLSNMEFALLDVAVSQQNSRLGLQESIAIPSLRISQAAMQWPERRLAVGEISIDEPRLLVWHESGAQISLTSLLSDAQTVPPDATEGDVGADEAAAFEATIDRFSVNGLDLVTIDHGAGDAEIVIEDLSLETEGLNLASGSAFPLSLSGDLASGGQFGVTGEFGLLPEFTLQVDATMAGLELAAAQPWLSQLINLELAAGVLDLEAHALVEPEQPLAVEGSLSVPGLLIRDSATGGALVGWDDFRIDRFGLDLALGSLDISRITATSPYARFAIDETGESNFQGLMPDSSEDQVESEAQDESGVDVEVAAAEAPGEDTGTPFSVRIEQVDVDAAALDFSDATGPADFSARISEFSGTLTALSTTSSEPVAFNLSGNLDEFGLLEVSGRVLPAAPIESTEVVVIFRNVDLARITPYSTRFVGRAIDDGRIDLALRYSVSQSLLDGQNEVVIERLALGDRVDYPDAADLPLDLAVALLRRPDGTIEIELPVSGDLANPEFSIGGIVFSAFTGLITRAVAAPFNLLGSLVGAGADEDIGTVLFRPGAATLTGPEREKVGKLAEALALRPDLMLQYAGSFVTAEDTFALQEASLQQAVDAGLAAQLDGQVPLAQRRRVVLESLAAERTGIDLAALQSQFTSAPVPDAPDAVPTLDETAYLAELRRRLVESQPLPEGGLDRLARQRAESIRNMLVTEGGVDSSRVSLLEPVAGEPDDDGWIPVELELGS